MSKLSGPFYIFCKDSTAANGSLNICKAGTDQQNPVVNLKILGTANTLAAYIPTVTNAAYGQASILTIPDVGSSTANFVMSKGTQTLTGTYTITAATITTGTVTTLTSTTANLTTANITTGNITNLKYGATPVAQADPASCTISAAAGASNVSTVTIQLKDGSGTNLTRSMAFRVYASSASDGLTLASAASTGFSVASGGLSLANGSAVTTQIVAISSASGGCVLSLTDTGKQTSYLVLVLPNGNKISAQLTSGSYGA